MYIPNTRWTWAFLLTAVTQAVIALVLEAYVFARFQNALKDNVNDHNESRTIPTYLAVFMFGYIYQIALVYDALAQKNTIQVIGLVIYNLGILIYAAIQFDQIDEAITALKALQGLDDPFVWTEIRAELIALPILMAVATVVFAFIAWKLYDEFAWTIYKHISADLRMKRRYLTFQIYIALLKFDFFFFLAFTVQFLVVVENTSKVELALTAAALAITFILLFLAAWWVRRESVAGMIAVIVIYFIALGYFLFKLVRMYAADAARLDDYKPARKSLTSFAVLTILLLIITIVTACICTHNFNKGLKPFVNEKSVGRGSEGKGYANEMPSLSGPAPAQRMEID
ncbi:hypothetical protein DPSP01_009337 [Paraphaeosphaeria sporulosa]|uniref:Uncharacterized protein n=1 Tax=Paraphaeosphaeria sporulosa TaxID=1460663 RepID=A0A177CLN1_9PLEO|nr:uncharacterized protein CC84DRAFT_708337 [Paraphaeosphaeria sporulosa]OAG07729.1 hypothetical protein CC84DRAFT_708337 [Paraphaeosphaeria sporulosa]